MQAFFSCFSCGEKTSTIAEPQPIPITLSKIDLEKEHDQKSKVTTHKKQLIQQFDDDKSRSATTMTFLTSDTAPSLTEDEESYIRKKIEQMRKLQLPERKAMESEFIRQNLSKNKTAVVCLVEKEWSQQYTVYLKNINQKELRSINNMKLFDFKNNLRGDIKQREDYFIINDRVWKFVSQMYGGGPAIYQDTYFPVVQVNLKKLEVPIIGIVNPLNLCFAIAVVQCLASNQHFSQFFHKKMFDDSKKKNIFHNALHKIIKTMIQTNSTKVDIKQFASLFENKFSPFQQHDSHEFLLYLTDVLQEEARAETSIIKMQIKSPQNAYSNYFRNNRSIVDKLFVGLVETQIVCTRCEHQSISYNTIIDIELQIIDKSIEKCLQKHFSQEKLDDYQCEHCKRKTKASKQQFLVKTPNNLVLTLKKFKQTGKKIEQRVKYPYEIDIKKVTKGHCGDTKYILQSILVHKGTKSTKGHYYCYTHRPKKDTNQKAEWYYANDEICKEIEVQDVLGRDAYILFYQRR